jgi:hypothetical protein
MKTCRFAAAILACAASFLHAKEDPAARQLLDAALQQTRPYRTASRSYTLESEFTIYEVVPIKGHYILKWKEPSHWWSKVEVEGFVQTTIRDGELEYTLRNQPVTPARVTDLFSLFSLDGKITPLNLDKVKTTQNNGTEEICLGAHRKEFKNLSEELCVDRTSHDLLKETFRPPHILGHSRHFGNYIEFNGRRYPHQLDLLINGVKVVSANVTSLVSAPFDPALLVPPQGAIERRKCADMKPPAILKSAHPDYGSQGEHAGVFSRAVITATVLADGSVSDVGISERGVDFMNEPSLKAVKQFKFKPAMCGSDPIVSDAVIEMDFVPGQRQW